MCIGIHAVGLLIVGGEVLDTCTHVVFLHTDDVGSCGLTSYHGILGVVFEVTAAKRVAHDIEGRCQQHVGTIFLYLLTNSLTNFLYQLCVPGRGQQCTNGEVCTIVSGRVAFPGSVDAQSGRTISQYDGRNA